MKPFRRVVGQGGRSCGWPRGRRPKFANREIQRVKIEIELFKRCQKNSCPYFIENSNLFRGVGGQGGRSCGWPRGRRPKFANRGIQRVKIEIEPFPRVKTDVELFQKFVCLDS